MASSVSVSNPFRTRILAGEICPVLSVKWALFNEIPMLCKMAGIHALFIDMEHSSQNLHTVSQLILACNYVGVSPLVRVPSKSHWHISRVLDAGAAGIIVPHVETVEEVRDLVQSAKYAPLGARGSAAQQPILNFQTVPPPVQNETLNRETMLIPMMETPGAVDLAEEFLAVEGVDGVMIGSNDLCADLKIWGQYDNPIYQDAVTKIIRAGVKAGKPIGIGGIGGRLDLLEKFYAMGATWALTANDGGLLQAGLNKVGETYVGVNERLQNAKSAA